MGRRILIGDIQGCREELEALLDAAHFDPAADRLMPVGDLVGRGPQALETLRLLIELRAEPVLGNHDIHLLSAAAGLRRAKPENRLDPVLAADDRDELLGWLRAQPLVRREPDLLIVHAAIHPRWRDPVAETAGLDPLGGDPRVDFATRTRWCDAAGGTPSEAMSEELESSGASDGRFSPWYRFYDPALHGNRRVVYGHWSARGLVNEVNALGLDTGCVWGKELTAFIPEEQRLVSVPARRTYARPSG